VWCVENPAEGDGDAAVRLARYREVRDQVAGLIADELLGGR